MACTVNVGIGKANKATTDGGIVDSTLSGNRAQFTNIRVSSMAAACLVSQGESGRDASGVGCYGSCRLRLGLSDFPFRSYGPWFTDHHRQLFEKESVGGLQDGNGGLRILRVLCTG